MDSILKILSQILFAIYFSYVVCYTYSRSMKSYAIGGIVIGLISYWNILDRLHLSVSM